MKENGLFHAHLFALADIADGADRIAVHAEGESLTYGTLAEAVRTQAHKLHSAGLRPGQRIAFLFDRDPGLIVNMLGALRAGVPFTILNRREGLAETAAKLRLAGFAALIAAPAHEEKGREIARQAGLAYIAPSHLSGEEDNDTLPEPKPEDEAIIIFTSGSSGAPKAVRISQQNIMCNTRNLLALTPLEADDHLLHVMPLSHTNGILNQLLAPLYSGARVTILPRFKETDFIAQMERFQPTIITGVPTIYQRLLAHPIPAAATARLRMARCGSAPLARDTQRRIEKHLGVEVIVSYGQTETTCTCCCNPPGRRKIGSVGRALPGQEVAILATDHDEVLPQGATGEVAVRGPIVALGYVGRAPFDSRTWMRTGDCGYLDEERYLFLTARLKEIIIRGGENLSPGQIEEALLAQPGIRAACVCGVPDTDLGEVPMAFVECTGDRFADLAVLNAAIAEGLSPAHQLRDVFVLDKLPTNDVGKVDRKALTQLAMDMMPA